MLIQKVLQRD